ncbi:DnaJ domain-containing protein [Pseudemcibacter aquimaris]|uniref:DnaJ domain-containing protein n=1 Tax=Pseudemcibacter aquimaris TaxID=2857064 RepID=UPI002012B97E|nr:DnaJ domain-containing protein [Pseudemcibacter aquimaris]MCC3860283.1 DnaJ domain-containing protein [Pseudemcibacter aquimaris]WDU57608.1 DnaJ domain-containing protein [Pseudemcibacter aquimaris]
MSRPKSWTFPRWGDYHTEKEPISVRLCDYEGCDEPGDYPAPKAPDSKEKWYFCQPHVAEFNKNWNYFDGLSREEAMKRAQEEMRKAKGYRSAGTFDDAPKTYGKEERRADALEILDLDDDATDAEIKSSYRRLAKQYHPDTNLGDAESAIKFQQVKAAYEVLKKK